MAVTWIVTREAKDAAKACGELAARGLHAVAVPCLETVPLPWPWPAPADATILSSRRGVSAWVSAGQPRLGVVAAMAPSTASALREHGVEPHVTASNGLVSLALALRRHWRSLGAPRWVVQHPTSDLGLTVPERAEADLFLAEVGLVDHRAAYRSTAPAGLAHALAPHVRGDWAVTFASPSAIDHFLAAAPPAGLAPPCAVACTGASTARHWQMRRPQGWPGASASPEQAPTPTPEVSP